MLGGSTPHTGRKHHKHKAHHAHDHKVHEDENIDLGFGNLFTEGSKVIGGGKKMNIIDKLNFVGESIEKAGGLASLTFDMALSKKVH